MLGFHSTSPPVSTEAALDPANYQITQGFAGQQLVQSSEYGLRLFANSRIRSGTHLVVFLAADALTLRNHNQPLLTQAAH